jgi:RHS repeat-associated protein
VASAVPAGGRGPHGASARGFPAAGAFLVFLVGLLSAPPLGAQTGGVAGAAESAPAPGAPAIDAASGIATVAFPIDVPPGRHGLEPAVALRYNSSAGSGNAGYGFTLQIGAIERSMRLGIPSYDDTDLYTLTIDGRGFDLVPIDAGSTRFRTRVDTGFLVERRSGGPYGPGSTWWVARGRDGRSYRFGFHAPEATGRTSQVRDLRWGLDRIEDAQGNALEIDYAAHGQLLYPSIIRYAGHPATALPPSNQVLFCWEGRGDVKETRGGDRLAYRLATIRTAASGQQVRAYTLVYDGIGDAADRIGECGAPPGGGGASDDGGSTDPQPGGGGDGKIRTPRGREIHSGPAPRQETLLEPPASTTAVSYCAWNDPDCPLDSLLVAIERSGGGNGLPPVTYRYETMSGVAWRAPVAEGAPPLPFLAGGGVDEDFGVRVEDLNRDGLPDFVQSFAHLLGDEYQVTQGVYLNTGAGFVHDPVWSAGLAGLTHPDDPTRSAWFALKRGNRAGLDMGARFLDVNDDGLPDVVRVARHFGYGLRKSVHLNTGSGFTADVAAQFSIPDEPFTSLIATPNHDHNRDTGLRIGDVNADGRADLLLSRADWGGPPTRRVYLHDRDGYRHEPGWILPDEPFMRAVRDGYCLDMGVRLVELNGDGRVDLFVAANVDGLLRYRAYLNGGSPGAPGPTWTAATGDWSLPGMERFVDVTGTGDGASVDRGLRVGSLNGDGRSSIIVARSWDGVVSHALYSLDLFGGWFTQWAQPLPGLFLVKRSGEAPRDQGVRLIDLNGDGGLDYVAAPITGPREYRPMVGWHGRPLLVEHGNGMGGTTRLGWAPAPHAGTIEGGGRATLPFPLPVVSESMVSDGMGGAYVTRYEYAGPFFHHGSRDFRGFRMVRATGPGDIVVEGTFRQQPALGAAPLRGAPERRLRRRASDGALFSDTAWTYDTGDAIEPLQHPVVREATSWFDWTATDPGAAPLVRTAIAWSYDWDDAGAPPDRPLRRRIERREGDVADPADDRILEEEFAFALDPAAGGGPAAGRWFLDLPVHRSLRDAAGVVLSESWLFYDGLGPGAIGARGLPSREARRGGMPGAPGARGPDDPENPVVSRRHDAYGNVVTETDPLGRERRLSYDATFTFPETETDPLGRTTVRRFQPATGVLLSATDPNGRTIRFEYDGLGRKIAEYGPDDPPGYPAVSFRHEPFAMPARVHRYAREVAGQGERAGTAGCIESIAFFDGLGRLLQTKNEGAGGGMVVTGAVAFDAAGRVAIEAEPFDAAAGPGYVPATTAPWVRRLEHDAEGRRVAITDAAGAVWRTEHAGLTTREIDPLGHRRDVTRDTHGLVVSVEEYLGEGPGTWTSDARASYRYDAAGRLTGITEPGGAVTRIGWDTLGRRVLLEDPHIGTWHYTHDPKGNLIAETDPLGRVTRLLYDPLDRLLEKQHADGTRAVWAYDEGGAAASALGRLTSIGDPTGVLSFRHDAAGRVIETSRRIGGTTYTVTTAFDPQGRPTLMSLPAGRSVAYSYDAAGNLRAAEPYVPRIDHDRRGQVTRLLFKNGVLATRDHDEATGRLLSWAAYRQEGAGDRLATVALDWSAEGRLEGLTEQYLADPGRTQVYSHDARHRLTRALGPEGDRRYVYDAIGNLVVKEGIGRFHDDPARPQWVTRTSRGQSFAYDAAGGVTSIIAPGSEKSLSYDAAGRPARFRETPSGHSVSWEYDAAGRMVREITERPDARSVRLSPFPQVEVRDGRMELHVFAGDLRVAIDEVEGARTLFLIPDHLGSPRLALDDDGDLRGRYDFLPFGTAARRDGDAGLTHLFAGAPEEAGGMFLLMGSRLHDPDLGRLLQADVLVRDPYDLTALHRYAYARNDPVNLSDPGGRTPWPAILILGAVAFLDRETRAEVGTSVLLTAASIFLTGTLGPGFGAGRAALEGSKAALYAAALTPIVLRSPLGQGAIEGYALLFRELGLSPKDSQAAAQMFHWFVFNSSFQRAFAKGFAEKGGIHEGRPIGDPAALEAETAASGSPIGPPTGDVYGTSLAGVNRSGERRPLHIRALVDDTGQEVGAFGTHGFPAGFQHGAAGFSRHAPGAHARHPLYGVGGVSTHQFARELFLAGYNGTLFTLTGRFSDFLLEFVYGPYGGGLVTGIHAGNSGRFRPDDSTLP